MLNPSAATELPSNYPAQDYGRSSIIRRLPASGWSASASKPEPEAATRFAISHPAMGTILVGAHNPHEAAPNRAGAAAKLPLPAAGPDARAARAGRLASGEKSVRLGLDAAVATMRGRLARPSTKRRGRAILPAPRVCGT
jgi:hypothetical protein